MCSDVGHHPRAAGATTFIRNCRRESTTEIPAADALALEQLDLRGYDLVISSRSGPARVIAAPDARHVSYVHSPMRYLWVIPITASAGRL
jgi:hypothetical protein